MEEFEFDRKNRKYRQYHTINEILFSWYKKCASANVFPDGPLFKEEAMLIKEGINNTEHFSTSNCWLEKWKLSCGLRETCITAEADDIPQIIKHTSNYKNID